MGRTSLSIPAKGQSEHLEKPPKSCDLDPSTEFIAEPGSVLEQVLQEVRGFLGGERGEHPLGHR